MATIDKVRWGVIGATSRIAGAWVIPAICESDTAQLVAVASRSLTSAQTVAGESCAEGVTAYGDYDSLLADSRVEAIYIPLPNNLHLEWAVEAMNNGKHVLCEKPLALNATEAAEMAETAADNGVLLSEAFMYRYEPLQAEVFQLVRDGALGEIESVRAEFAFVQNSAEDYRRDMSMGGGALLDVGCYAVHVARQAFGREPHAVQATWTLDDATGVDTKTIAMLDFGGGRKALVECAFGPEFKASYTIAGQDSKATVTKHFGEGRTTDVSCDLIHGDGPAQTRSVPPTNMYVGEIDAMSRRVRGEDVFLLPPADAVANMRVLDALAASARTGENVHLTGEA